MQFIVCGLCGLRLKVSDMVSASFPAPLNPIFVPLLISPELRTPMLFC